MTPAGRWNYRNRSLEKFGASIGVEMDGTDHWMTPWLFVDGCCSSAQLLIHTWMDSVVFYASDANRLLLWFVLP